MRSLIIGGLLITVVGSVARLKSNPYSISADEVMAAASLQTPGISPKTNPSVPVTGTLQFTVTSVAPVPATVISRDTFVATVTDAGLVTGRNVGIAWLVATVFNGTCTVLDSARVTVIDTTTAGEIEGDSTRGRLAYLASCQKCHGADIATDLELFNYNSVVRRAMAHVDTLTALDILAHVATLGPGGPLDSLTQLFQPGTPATKTASDIEFQTLLTGGTDEWPTRWTRDTLLAKHPRQVRIPIDLPRWSNETSRYDWLPFTQFEIGLPTGVANATIVKNAFATYRANLSWSNMNNLTGAISGAAHDVAIADAPCMYLNAPARYTNETAQGCFDVRKFVASLCYITGIRLLATPDTIMARCQNNWWEGGHMAHKAQQMGKDIELRTLQICSWIYLGSLHNWSAGANAGLYMSGPCGHGVGGLGYGRWTSYTMMQMLTNRLATAKGTIESCRDIWSMADHGHSGHLLNSMTYAFNIMLYRLDNAMHVHQGSTRSACTENSTSTSGSVGATGYLGNAMVHVNQRCGSGCFNTLKPLADSVRKRINQGF